MTLGERIGIKRKESGLSQEKLGELFNVSRQTVYKWEADLAVPELDKLKGMAELFGVSLDYLINGKEEKKQLKTETNPKIRKLFITVVLLLIGISVFLLISLNGLKNDYLNLKNSVDNMNVYVNNRINSIVRSLENTMSTYSSLSVDYAVEEIKADQDRLYFKASYLPKTISDETRAVFHCSSNDESYDFEAVLNDKSYFVAELECPISNYVEISIELIDGNIHNNEIIGFYYGLKNASFGDFDIVWPIDAAYDKDNYLERDCVVLRHSPGTNDFDIKLAKILSAKMSLYRDGELICEYDGSDIDLEADKYVFKRPEGIRVETDKYSYSEVLMVTDEFGHTLTVEQDSEGNISIE